MSYDLKEIDSLITEANKDRGKSFAEFLSILFKDKLIEIYLGDAYESLSTEQSSTDYPAIFCGKIIGAFKECLILDCPSISKSKKLSFGKVIVVNERAIRALSEVTDIDSTLENMLLRGPGAVRMLENIK